MAVKAKTTEESGFHSFSDDVLNILLMDRTSGENILWATDNYSYLGDAYAPKQHMMLSQLKANGTDLIRPRVNKSREEQVVRVRDKAEVFTPAWICNAQNNMVDAGWFGYEGVFNTEGNKTWQTTPGKVRFPDEPGKDWKSYVSENRLEIACGEAPYLVSRYDAATGEEIAVKDRVGMLDRKLRIVGENVPAGDIDEWTKWVITAYQSTYGYEWQGDSLLLARENLLYTLMEYYASCYGNESPQEFVLKIADVISWNIWQMDGLKGVIPYSCKSSTVERFSMFGISSEAVPCPGCKGNNIKKHNGTYCCIMDWEKGEKIRYIDMLH